MSQMISLDQLPPELLSLIEAHKAGTMGQRSPIRQQLKDLRTPQTEKGRLHRPAFSFSAEADPDAPPYVHQKYPRLMFHERGQEVVVDSEAAEQALGPEWHESPAVPVNVSPFDQARAEFDALSPEDQQLVLELQRKAKIARVQSALAGLTDSEAERFAAAVPDTASAPKKAPVGRAHRA